MKAQIKYLTDTWTPVEALTGTKPYNNPKTLNPKPVVLAVTPLRSLLFISFSGPSGVLHPKPHTVNSPSKGSLYRTL